MQIRVGIHSGWYFLISNSFIKLVKPVNTNDIIIIIFFNDIMYTQVLVKIADYMGILLLLYSNIINSCWT